MKFAKIYEREGRQVLVFLDNNEDGEPVVKMHVNAHGLWVTQAFHPKDDCSRDSLFEHLDEETAFEILDGIDERVGRFVSEDEPASLPKKPAKRRHQ